MEDLRITHDRCGGPVAKEKRSRVRFSPKHRKRRPIGLGPGCVDRTVLEPLGLIPKRLPFGDSKPIRCSIGPKGTA
jgi:hypothetical protein